METIIRKLSGFSGSEVLLIKDGDLIFVRKIENVDRNYERLSHLRNLGFNVPEIYKKESNILDIQYIPSLDVKSYLKFNSISNLVEFILKTLEKLSNNREPKDYSTIYKNKLNDIDFSLLPFSKEQLFDKLPKILYTSEYFGDLTLENILYGNDAQFYLIDGATIEYDSYIFDIAKLRQDLKCKWFLRLDSLSLDVKLNAIEKEILDIYPEANDDYILILKLLRVYKHAKENSFEQQFLLKEINKLWKL